MELTKIHYVAGLLEGEGSFGFYDCPVLQLNMTDLDVVEKIRNIISSKSIVRVNSKKNESKGHKIQYVLHISGSNAIEWMLTLYPLMSIRRKEKIKEVVQKWKEMAGTKDVRKNLLIKLIKFGYSEESAKLIAYSK